MLFLSPSSTRTKIAKTAGRNSNSYDYNFEEDPYNLKDLSDKCMKRNYEACSMRAKT